MPTGKQLTRVVIDNGGGTCKVGFAGQAAPVKLMPNGLAKSRTEHKVFVGDMLDKCQDFSALQYRLSLERGGLVNWDTQAEVWARAFGPEVLNKSPADCSLLLTETPMHPESIQDTLDEMVFEHFGFGAYCTRPAASLAAVAIGKQQQKAAATEPAADGAAAEPPPLRPAALVVDAGFSATHCVPIYGSAPINKAIKRLNVGGKMLTSHLKTIVSYRSYNVMEETWLMNDVKERLCYVSLDFANELALTRFKGKKNTLRREFIMPDYVNHFKGRIRDPNDPAPEAAAASAAAAGKSASGEPPKKKAHTTTSDEQVLKVGNERIAVPEVLFNPSDIGIEQAGLAECIVQSVEACQYEMRDALYGNIVLTGGTSLFPNMAARLKAELRALVPGDTEIEITSADDPIKAAWSGGSMFAATDGFKKQVVTKEEYQEHGSALCRKRFGKGECVV